MKLKIKSQNIYTNRERWLWTIYSSYVEISGLRAHKDYDLALSSARRFAEKHAIKITKEVG